MKNKILLSTIISAFILFSFSQAWLAQHFWWRWEYSQDESFLRDHAYPFLRENADFFEDFLTRDTQGRLSSIRPHWCRWNGG